jgi:RNase P subunit RPR2
MEVDFSVKCLYCLCQYVEFLVRKDANVVTIKCKGCDGEHAYQVEESENKK